MDIKCKAILSQGEKKGQRCWRPALENKYCGKHINIAKLEEEKAAGKIKCSNHRCLTTVEPTVKYCDFHLEAKNANDSLKTFCKALIEQTERKGQQCKKEAKKDGYCGKHARQIVVEKANTALCEAGKRGCFKEVKAGCKKCKDCLNKQAKKDNEKYYETISDPETCRMCYTKPYVPARGINGQALMTCLSCHDKEIAVEAKRPERSRNYQAEKKANLETAFDAFKYRAMKRGLTVSITFEQFVNIVNKPCVYCGYYAEESAIGVDRIDSTRSYVIENCVSCCGVCNIMKLDHPLQYFTEHVLKIAAHICANPIVVANMNHIPVCNRKENKAQINKDYGNIHTIIELYEKKELQSLIDWSILQKKSARFVDRLQQHLDYNLSTPDFIKFYKHANELNLREMSMQKIGKKRMQSDEKIMLFNQERSAEYIEWSIHTFGETKGLLDKVNSLVQIWKTYTKEEKVEAIAKLDIWINNARTAAKKAENTISHV
jgi:hypothetical protein